MATDCASSTALTAFSRPTAIDPFSSLDRSLTTSVTSISIWCVPYSTRRFTSSTLSAVCSSTFSMSDSAFTSSDISRKLFCMSSWNTLVDSATMADLTSDASRFRSLSSSRSASDLTASMTACLVSWTSSDVEFDGSGAAPLLPVGSAVCSNTFCSSSKIASLVTLDAGRSRSKESNRDSSALTCSDRAVNLWSNECPSRLLDSCSSFSIVFNSASPATTCLSKLSNINFVSALSAI